MRAVPERSAYMCHIYNVLNHIYRNDAEMDPYIYHIWIKYVLYRSIYMKVVSGKTHICAKYILY